MTSSATKSPERPSGQVRTADAFLGGRIELVQNAAGHRGGSDAVFLAAAVPAKPGDRVLDAGCGAGTAGLCLLERVPGTTVTGVEIDADQVRLAAENAARNGFGSRYESIEADLTGPARTLNAAGLVREGYDHVMANPPFYREGEVRVAPDAARASAHVMEDGALFRWVRFLTTMAAPKATLTLIHRADALGELLDLLKDRFGDLAIYPLFPREGVPASRVIIRGRKNSRAISRLLPGLVLHQGDGSYGKDAEAVLRGGSGLAL